MGLTLGGIWCTATNERDFLPDFTVPKLTVAAPCPGLPAADIRELVTIPLENALSSLSGLKRMGSISRSGISVIEIEYPWGTDIFTAGMECRELIDTAWGQLPSDAPKPRLVNTDPVDLPLLTIAVFPVNGDLTLARRLAGREIKSMLQRLEGVGSVSVSGGYEEEIRIEVDSAAAAAQGLSLIDIHDSLASAYIEFPAGSITNGIIEMSVKTKAGAEKLADIAELYINSREFSFDPTEDKISSRKLKEIALIGYGKQEQSSFFFTGKKGSPPREAVMIEIRRIAGASPAGTADAVKKALPEIARGFGKDLEIIITDDRSIELDRALKYLIMTLIYGCLFAFIIILMFMRNLKKAAILLAVLPASLLCSILFMTLSGAGFNLMSLCGLTLGVGMVVDNAIIVIERLDRSRSSRIAETVSELAPSLFGSTATTVLVFTPLLFMKGLAGVLFSDLSLSVIYSLSSSLLLSLTAVPILYQKIKPVETGARKDSGMYRFIRKALRFSLRKPFWTAALIIIVCAVFMIPAGDLPVELIPQNTYGKINCTFTLPPDKSFNTVKECALKLSTVLLAFPEIETVELKAGEEPDNIYHLASAVATNRRISIQISTDPTTDSQKLYTELTNLEQIHSGEFRLLEPENIIESLLGISSRRDWMISGGTPAEVEAAAGKLIETAGPAILLSGAKQTVLRLYPDRKAAAAAQMSPGSIGRQIAVQISGSTPGRLNLGGREIRLRLRAAEELRKTIDDIMALPVIRDDCGSIRLDSLTEIKKVSESLRLFREDRLDAAVFRLENEASRQQIKLLNQAGARPYRTSSLKEQRSGIYAMFILAAAFLYLCLGVQFESFGIPLLLMLCIPPSVAGTVLFLRLTGESINLYSCLGCMVVMGISVNNGILLIEESRRRIRRSASSAAGSAYLAAASRLRPIMMTYATTAAALIPLAVMKESSQASLAAAIIGGLSVSTIISILILPWIIIRNQTSPE